MSQVHAQARTKPRTRAEIKEAPDSLAQLAERYNISRLTARKCKGHTCPQDHSHRPHKLSTTLSPAQEAIVVELRRSTLLPLDDLVAVVREFIHPGVSPTVSSARRENPRGYTSLTCVARRSTLSTACAHHATPRPIAWWSASMVVSAKW